MGVRARRRSVIASSQSDTLSTVYKDLVLADGAVGYWPLSESLGTAAYDGTINGNNGVYNGDYVLADSTLADGLTASVSLVGIDDFISIADNNLWSCDGMSGAITVEAWIKPDVVNSVSQFIIAKHEEWQLRIESDGRILWDVNNMGLSSVMNCYSSVVSTGQVYHIMATYNRSIPILELYLNGVLSGSSNSATGSSSNRSTALRIGGRTDNVGNEFDGVIGHVAVYPSRLTASQAVAHYSVGRGINNAPPTPQNAAAVWWADDIAQTDGSAIDSWVDRVGGKTVSNTGSQRPVLDADGIAGRASVNFDGVDDCLKMSSSISTSSTGCIVAVFQNSGTSFSAQTIWCAGSTTVAQQYLIGRMGHTTVDQAGIQSHHGSIDSVWQVDESILAQSNRVLEWSATGGTWNMRLNNIPKSLVKRTGDATPDQGYWLDDLSGHNSWAIGAERFMSGPVYDIGHFNMRLAYLGVFDSPLSTQDRYDLYKWIEEYYGITDMPGLSSYTKTILDDTPLGYWPLSENSGSIAYESMLGNNATYSNSPSLAQNGPSLLESSVLLNGSNQYVLSPSSPTFAMQASSAWSLEIWMKTTFSSASIRTFMICRGTGGVNEDEVAGLTLNNGLDGRITVNVPTGAMSRFNVESDGGWNDGQWHHIVATAEVAGPTKLYIDGVLRNSVATARYANQTNSRHVSIGANVSNGVSQYFPGSLACVAIYNYALTGTQVLTHFNAM